MLRRVAKEAHLWLNRWAIHHTDLEWHYGLVTFFGITPCGDVRTKYYDPPPDRLDPALKYVTQVAARLKRDAEADNRRALVERHELMA